MSADIDPLSRFAYDNGHTVIGWAEVCIASLIDANEEVRKARAQDPAMYPLYGPDTSNDMVARRALAWLMDAGWIPPTIEAP